jgi:hypothetical protein
MRPSASNNHGIAGSRNNGDDRTCISAATAATAPGVAAANPIPTTARAATAPSLNLNRINARRTSPSSRSRCGKGRSVGLRAQHARQQKQAANQAKDCGAGGFLFHAGGFHMRVDLSCRITDNLGLFQCFNSKSVICLLFPSNYF